MKYALLGFYAFESASLNDYRLRYNIVILLYDDETDMQLISRPLPFPVVIVLSGRFLGE